VELLGVHRRHRRGHRIALAHDRNVEEIPGARDARVGHHPLHAPEEILRLAREGQGEQRSGAIRTTA